MLSMPSVSSTSNLITRPALVAEAVRPAAPLQAIEPTTAVSKERSRAENQASNASSEVVDALYAAAGKKRAGLQAGNGGGQVDSLAQGQNTPPKPPAEKSEIQKAMELQIKELLTNVWKASAKAVDFLLQRDSTAASQMPLTTLEPTALLGKKAADAARAGDANTKGVVLAYNARGGSTTEETAASTGQMLDVLA